MRTSILLDDELGERLRQEAKRRGVSFSQFLADAGRKALEAKEEEGSGAEVFKLITFSGSGTYPGVDLDKTSELLAAEDVARYGRRVP